MVEHDRFYVYRSGGMIAVVALFVIFFSVGLAALALIGIGLLATTPALLLGVMAWTGLTGLAGWNMEVGVEMRPEGLRFIHLIRPAYIVEYCRIQRVSIRMLRGMYYCFMRFGAGLFEGTFFPVGYWTRSGREKTDAFLTILADRANLTQTGRTPLGAPIYTRSPEDR